MTRSTRILSAVHLGANALLLWLGYYWLGIGESRTASLLWSAVVALVLVSLTCCLHGATFAYFVRQPERPAAGVLDLPSSFRTALRNMLAILTALSLILVLYFLLSWWSDYSILPSYGFSSWLTLKFRKPVRPNSVLRAFMVVTWLLRWVVLPVILLPWVAAVSSQGWRGLRHRIAKRRLYWLQAPVLLLCALWVPFLLLNWVPYVGRFSLEMVSFAIRLLVAYLLFVAAWLALAFLTSGGKPVLSHPSIEAKP
jgi:hypothetical protein